MTTILLFLATLAANPAPKCETYAPRLDGTQVTVCDGRVTRVEYVGRVGVK